MSEEAAYSAIADSPHWPASLQLEIARRPAGVRLVACSHRGPLYVQRPFYPEGADCPHIYLLHPPGGLVSGDSLDINVQLGTGAACLLTTPGAARVYRAREGGSRQYQRVEIGVESSAWVEWFPLETILFPGADVRLDTLIDLAAGARCAAWEITSFGLPANREQFERGRFEQRYLVQISGRPVFVDRFVLADDNRELLSAKAGLQARPVYGFFLMGPFVGDSPEEMLATLRQRAEQAGYQAEAAISRLGDFYLGRYLGGSAERARKCFELWWAALRPALLDRPASPPRIWLA